MINFKHFKEELIQVMDITRKLEDEISLEDIYGLSTKELAYLALQKFNFKKLVNSEQSINYYCQKLLDQTGFMKKSNDPIGHFLTVFMNIGKDMLKIKNTLEREARNHLRQVNEILEFYNTLPFILKYQNESARPTSTSDRMQLEFYKRCIAKKIEITDFLLHEIPRLAKKKSVIVKPDRSGKTKDILDQIDYHEDFPYTELLNPRHQIKYGLNLEKLDYRLINPLYNKYLWLDKKNWGETTYNHKIDASFQKRIKAEPFFQVIFLCLKDLPIIQDREEIFKELEYLFKRKKWYALYSLALPQVEGIFSEMLAMTYLKKPKNSLSEKAKSLRDYFEDATYTMDYYEFSLSELRNSFSHSGKVDNPKAKCYHLLMDIQYLLDICIDLNTPISKLTKQIKEGSASVSHIGHLSDLLNLVAEIDKEKKLAKVQKAVNEFMFQELPKEVNLEMMLEKLDSDFSNSIANFNGDLNLLMNEYDPNPLKIFTRSIKEISKWIPLLELEMNKLPILIQDHYKLLLDTNNFLKKFPKYFPIAPKTILELIEKFKVKHAAHLKILNYLSENIKFESQNYFMLYKSQMSHIISKE